tara:strand:- start:316 stop:660 length:345 start_codon:yes stop_codon:yes gene_type:complete
MEMEPQEAIRLFQALVLLLLLRSVGVKEGVCDLELLLQQNWQVDQVAEVLATHLQAQLQVLEVMLLADRVIQEVREDILEARAMVVAVVVLVNMVAIMMLPQMFLKVVMVFNIV